jgi:hypothetical protein
MGKPKYITEKRRHNILKLSQSYAPIWHRIRGKQEHEAYGDRLPTYWYEAL